MPEIIPSKDLSTYKTTCPYCGVGCGVLATVNHQTREVSVKGDPDHPANYGRLCSKGSALGETLSLDERLAGPMMNGQKISWDSALDTVAEKLQYNIDKHGPDSIMFYVSGQLLTEDYYVVNKFAKGFVGTNNIDSNSRLCMSSAVAGYKRAFGSDTVPNCYTDIEAAELFIICGSNMAWCHPVLFQRLKHSQEQDGKKVVVIDPRETDSCAIAQLHLPIKPGTDTVLFNGLFAYLFANNHVDEEYIQHCDNLDETLAAVKDFIDPKKVAEICDISLDSLLEFYQLFSSTEKTVTFYSMGVNQSSSGTDKVNSIINCHALTGRIGKEGAGPFSITGQPNAMGGREVGALANLLAAHYDLSNDNHRQQVQTFWNASNIISGDVGVTAPDLADAIEAGNIKVVWIMATNPVVSITQANKLAKALDKCELVIVSDCSNQSDTLRYANIILPAQGWSEKSGTVTNSERRISRQRRLLEPYAQAKPDWWIVSQVAQRMGFESFKYASEYEIFKEHAALSAYENSGNNTRSFNLSALKSISQSEYDNLLPVQWPVHADSEKQERFFADGKTYAANQKVQFVPITPRPPKSKTSKQFPLVLNTGRIRDQWHTMTRTALAPRLNQHLPEPFILINPKDAERYKILDGDLVSIYNKQGNISVVAKYSAGQRVGEIFCPMHWSNNFTKNARVGQLIARHLDPVSAQPEFKYTPVAIKPLSMQWYGKVLIKQSVNISPLIEHALVDYWVSNKCAASQEYVLAGEATKNINVLFDFAVNLLDEQLTNISKIVFTDAQQKSMRLAVFAQNELQLVMFIEPARNNLPNTTWLNNCFAKNIAELAQDLNVSEVMLKQWILVGRPAEGDFDVGRIVCSCFTVGEKTIQKTIAEFKCKTPAEIGKLLKAGTNCGSCVPELQAIIDAQPN